MTSLSEEAPSCQASNAGGLERQLARRDEFSAQANVETDRIEATSARRC